MTDHERLSWVRSLYVAGWCFVIAYVGIIAIELRRAAAITTSSFEDGVWGQRIEIVSFVALPQNIAMLALAAVVTAATHSPVTSWSLRWGFGCDSLAVSDGQ